jgi:hypothetical protein
MRCISAPYDLRQKHVAALGDDTPIQPAASGSPEAHNVTVAAPAFAGAQSRQTPKASLLVTFRRTSFRGLSTSPSAPRSPDFTSSALIVEQRLRL